MGIDRESSKGKSVKLILGPTHRGNCNVSRTDLLGKSHSQRHFVSRPDRSLCADPRPSYRQVVNQPHIARRSSQPPARPERGEGTGERSGNADTGMPAKPIQDGGPWYVRFDPQLLHSPYSTQGSMDQVIISKISARKAFSEHKAMLAVQRARRKPA